MMKLNKKILREFLDFRIMITTSIMKYLYAFIAVLMIVIVFFVLLYSKSEDINSFGLIFGLIILEVLWRLICEKLILAFSIHEMLNSLIKINNKKTSS